MSVGSHLQVTTMDKAATSGAATGWSPIAEEDTSGGIEFEALGLKPHEPHNTPPPEREGERPTAHPLNWHPPTDAPSCAMETL